MSMDSIVAETGGSKATLYPNFPSKDALFGGIVDDLPQQPAAVAPAPDYVDLPNPEGLRKLERANGRRCAERTGDRVVAPRRR